MKFEVRQPIFGRGVIKVTELPEGMGLAIEKGAGEPVKGHLLRFKETEKIVVEVNS